MTYRTEQDKINRREANQRYYGLEENKQQKRDYMKEYAKRDYVKEKARKYYRNNKLKWGGKREESKTILQNHYKWCEDNDRDTSWYQEVSNEQLNTENSERFTNYEKKTTQ